ncbi:MAG: DUF4325 domain-containing protein [Deltaproteobacteria bacterium]|nr:DUF4325 domain-containing protein [Deltaproteobacteria bacterium]
MADNSEIRRRALELIAEDGRDVAKRLAEEFGFSRQTANAHLKALLRDEVIKAEGHTRARVYSLENTYNINRAYIRKDLQEDRVWSELVAPVVGDLPDNVRDIWRYGVTEMVNNAIDHSGSVSVYVFVVRNALYTSCWVIDNGEGIFHKIAAELGLYDQREAILELAKGKLTTDPERHTGEGIFFASRMFDLFYIYSGKLSYSHHIDHEFDYLEENYRDGRGTTIFMRLFNDSKRIPREVFDRFAMPDEFTFAKTVVPVRLAQYEGEKLVSRSQAKRLYQRFEKFRYVTLDFEGVTEIGQAFADELFRVFTNEHPTVELAATNTTDLVAKMIARAQAKGSI